MKTEQQIKDKAITLHESASPEMKARLALAFEPGFFDKKNVGIDYVLDFLKVTKNKAIEKRILLFENPQNKRERYLNAVSLLPLITEKINGDWEPDYNNRSQLKWTPYFELRNGRWVFGGGAYDLDCSTFAGVYVYKTEKKAVRAGKEWIDLYADILNYTTK